MHYNGYKMHKLVRDSSVKNMEDKGTKVIWRPLPQTEQTQHLLLKLTEEQQEVAEALKANDKVELTSELADLLEIIHALAAANGIRFEAVETKRLEKRSTRGGFDEGIYVDEIHCPKGSFFDEYCAKDPAKYTPVK